MNSTPGDRIDVMYNNRIKELDVLLSCIDNDMQDIIMSYIANICNVDKMDMLSSCDSDYVAQVRWLLWYSLRIAYNETYDKIAERTSIDGCRFTRRAIGNGISNMTYMINHTPIWMHRWRLVEILINKYKDCLN